MARREPCGREARPSVEDREREMRETGYAARERVHGLSKANSAERHAGHAIGRAFIVGELSREQALAGEEYERVQRAYAVAIAARGRGASASDYDRMGGYDASEGDEEAYVETCAKARRRMAESRRALLEAGPFVLLAVDAWTIEDKQVWGLLGDLRLGLNALARLYQVRQWGKAA
jgi:hypothetical protein